jgi:hypothetical protein
MTDDDTFYGLVVGDLYRSRRSLLWKILIVVSPFAIRYAVLGNTYSHAALFTPQEMGLMTFGGIVPVTHCRDHGRNGCRCVR